MSGRKVVHWGYNRPFLARKRDVVTEGKVTVTALDGDLREFEQILKGG